MSDFAWRNIGEGFQFEFVDEESQSLAEVTLPPSCEDGNGSPCGLAKSAAAAKKICEEILLGTVLEG